MSKYLKLDINSNIWWANRQNIQLTTIEEVTVKADSNIVTAAGKQKWKVSLIMNGTAPFVLFDSKQEAEKWQLDNIINA